MWKLSRLFFGKRSEPIERVHHLILLVIRIVLLGALVGAVFGQRWTLLFIIALNFFMTFLPKLFEKRYKIDIPIEFEMIIVLLVYASLFLGEVQEFYTRLWWWDIVLHAGSGIALGFTGFIILYVLYKGDKIDGKPFTIAFFTFTFAMAIGAVWEIFEFGMDSIFGFNMQKSGLRDTMWDLIVDASGALIASFIGYLFLKRGEFFFFDKIIERFVRNNPSLFKGRNRRAGKRG